MVNVFLQHAIIPIYSGAEPEILVWGGQVVMLIYQLRQTSKYTHTHKLIY